ncbi:MAG: ATP-binding protein [Pseudomonadota bacterium]
MSSTRRSVLRSTVFAQVMRAFALFVITALAVLWGFTGLLREQISSQEWLEIDGETRFFAEIIEEDGLDDLIEITTEDLPLIWEDDFLYERLEEERFIYALRTDEVLLAGYEGLWPADTRELIFMDHPEIDVPVRAATVEADDILITIARFEPEDRYGLLWLAQMGSIALFLIGLPLSVCIGYFLSRNVFRRIETVSATAAAVADGDIARRAPETGDGDEFDRLARGINHMLDQLEQLNANIEAVSVGVAHDLKTPLANIGGRLELMARDLADKTALKAHIEASETYLAELLRIFDALLRLGEVESGRRKAAFAVLDLSDLVSQMGAAYAPVFEDAQKGLDLRVAPGLTVQGDRELLEQMLANLLENALEHSRDAAHASLVLAATAEGPELIIGDDGPGIPPAHRARVFERFYRADSSRTNPGSGLGLSLVKAIADLHGARIAMDENASGAVFILSFPTT